MRPLIEAVELGGEIKKVAVAAAEACSLEIAGIDLGIGVEGPVIIEVNTNAGGLDLFANITGVDIASKMAEYVGRQSCRVESKA